MLDVERLFRQQIGKEKWSNIDSKLERLRCVRSDEFNQATTPNLEQADSPIFACKFATKKGNEHILASVTEDGRLSLHDTKKKEEPISIQAHSNAIFDLCWMFEQMHIITVAGDHFAKLFSVSNSSIQELQLFGGHTRSIKTVASSKTDSSVFATGGRDSNIFIWDTRSAHYCHCIPDQMITSAHVTGKSTSRKWRRKYPSISGANSITGLVFQDDKTLISCAAGDGVIKVWDLRKNYKNYKKEPLPKYLLPYSGENTNRGYSNMLMDSSGMKLYVNCLDNTIYCYNIGRYMSEPVMKYTGHLNNTHYVKSSLSGDEQYLISGSSDHSAYIWNIKESLPLIKLMGHHAEVTSVAWCHTDQATCVTCSDDMTLKIWRLGSEELPDNWEVIGCGVAKKITINHLKRNLKCKDPPPVAAKTQILACKNCDNYLPCPSCNAFNKRKSDQPILETPQKKPKLVEPSNTNDELEVLNDLPNFAVDGEAPHLNYSPVKKVEADWLTKMRYEKSLFSRMSEDGPTPSKIPKLDNINNATMKKTKKGQFEQTDLLKYFKVTNKFDQQCGSKSPSCSSLQSHV